MLLASLHKDVVFLLLAGGAWTQPPLSEPWQGLGASGPEYRAWITLYYPYDGGLREGSRHHAISPPMPSEQKPGSQPMQLKAVARLHLRPWG